MSTNTQPIPAGYQAVMPYLILKDAAKFMDFAKLVFSASEKSRHMKDDKTLMHGELQIGGSTIMCGEASEEWQSQPAGLFVYVPDADETYKLAIAAGAKSIQELSDKEYGRTGGVTDSFGNTWWITSVKQ